jgi:hypothetical protein
VGLRDKNALKHDRRSLFIIPEFLLIPREPTIKPIKVTSKISDFRYYDSVRALANRDYLGDLFVRTTHRRRSLLTCASRGALPGKAPGALPARKAQPWRRSHLTCYMSYQDVNS